MRNVVFLSLMIVSSVAFGASYSDVSTVKGITVGASFARVLLDSMKEDVESCSDQRFYQLDVAHKEMYSAILAAKMAQQKVSLQLNGCVDGRPEISHVYVCDQHFCGR